MMDYGGIKSGNDLYSLNRQSSVYRTAVYELDDRVLIPIP
jgi:hypothetical protein